MEVEHGADKHVCITHHHRPQYKTVSN